jgi:hypothetical protein
MGRSVQVVVSVAGIVGGRRTAAVTTEPADDRAAGGGSGRVPSQRNGSAARDTIGA